MTCPYLEYRRKGEAQSFDTARAYCSAAGRFVEPMRADICQDRFAFDHAADCEIYLATEGDTEPTGAADR